MNPWNSAIASLIRFNYDINFIPLSIKALAFIYYIINYAIKGNCSQYQRVMAAAIVRKAFDNYDNNITTGSSNYTLTLDKFTLKAFNQLSHDREINGPLVASYWLNLPNHYFLKVIVKTINIALLQAKFLLILNSQNFNQSDDIVCIDSTKIRLYSIYKHYAYRDSAFDRISIYKYLQFVFIVKQSQQQEGDCKFADGHRQKEDFV